TPQERSIKLQEQVGKATDLMKDPNYLRFVQRNAITKNLYNNVVENLGKDDTIVDFNVVNKNLSLADEYLKGKISDNQFFTGLKNYTMDIKQADEFEKSIYTLMNDALTKGPKNWEKYAGDENAIVFIEKMHIASSEDQINTLYDYLMSNEVWKKRQETRSRFTGEDGLIDPNKVRDYAKNTVNFYRKQYGIGDEAQDFTTNTKTNVLRQGTQTTTHQQEVINGLKNSGYEVVDPSEIANDDSASYIEQILTTPDSQLSKDEIARKRILERAVRPAPTTGETSSASTPNYSSGIKYGVDTSYRHPITVQSESGYDPGIQSGLYYTVGENGKKTYVKQGTPGAIREPSFGLYQFNLDNGELGKFMDYAKSNGYQIPEELTSESAAKFFQDERDKDKESFSRLQENYVANTMEPQLFNKMKGRYPDIPIDSGIADLLVSTRIQFGQGGYNNIINDLPPDIKTRDEFIDALTQGRKNRASSSGIGFVNERYDREAEAAKKATTEIKQPEAKKPQETTQNITRVVEPVRDFGNKILRNEVQPKDLVEFAHSNPDVVKGTNIKSIVKEMDYVKEQLSRLEEKGDVYDRKNINRGGVNVYDRTTGANRIMSPDEAFSFYETRLEDLASELNKPENLQAIYKKTFPEEYQAYYDNLAEMLISSADAKGVHDWGRGSIEQSKYGEGYIFTTIKGRDTIRKRVKSVSELSKVLEKDVTPDPETILDMAKENRDLSQPYTVEVKNNNSTIIPEVGDKPSVTPQNSQQILLDKMRQNRGQ
ncbi:hypothetical protein KC660_04725, partial [Candidatus Dojkabacteria bacterium]|nr:hypothetical protein [Candidatus Dojkabacteria bacterium]